MREGYSSRGQPKDTGGRDWKNIWHELPEWASTKRPDGGLEGTIETDPVKANAWFRNVTMSWSAETGIVKIEAENPVRANWLIDNYLFGLAGAARGFFSGVKGIVICPKGTEELSSWKQRCATPEPIMQGNRRTESIRRVDGLISRWKSGSMRSEDTPRDFKSPISRYQEDTIKAAQQRNEPPTQEVVK